MDGTPLPVRSCYILVNMTYKKYIQNRKLTKKKKVVSKTKGGLHFVGHGDSS